MPLLPFQSLQVMMVKQILENQNAHVYAKINEDFFQTSKVILPTHAIYNKTKYSQTLLNTFENLRKEFTGASQKLKIEVKYIDLNEKYSSERRQIISVDKTEEVKTTGLQQMGFASYEMEAIQKSIPKGFKLYSVDTTIFNADIHKRKIFPDGSVPKTRIECSIQYEKITQSRRN